MNHDLKYLNLESLLHHTTPKQVVARIFFQLIFVNQEFNLKRSKNQLF